MSKWLKYSDRLMSHRESRLKEEELIELLNDKEDEYGVVEVFKKNGKRDHCLLSRQYDLYELPNYYRVSCKSIDKLKKKKLLKHHFVENRMEHWKMR